MEKEKFFSIKEKEKSYEKVINALNAFLDLKNAYEIANEEKEAGGIDKERYEKIEKELDLTNKDLLWRSKEIAEFFREQKDGIYTYDEIIEKLKKVEKDQELNTVMRSN